MKRPPRRGGSCLALLGVLVLLVLLVVAAAGVLVLRELTPAALQAAVQRRTGFTPVAQRAEVDATAGTAVFRDVVIANAPGFPPGEAARAGRIEVNLDLRSFLDPRSGERAVASAVVEFDRVLVLAGERGGPSNFTLLLERSAGALWPEGSGPLVVRELELAVHTVELPPADGVPGALLPVNVRLSLRDVRSPGEILVPLVRALRRAGVPAGLLPQVPADEDYVFSG